MLDVTITTDGSCLGNPGPGGWAALLRCKDKEKLISGYDRDTTNNKMELRAPIEAIKLLNQPCNVTIRTDSTYIITVFEDIENRMKSGLRTKSGKPMANSDLLKELYVASIKHSHTFQLVKVPAHAGDPDNERCDKRAREEIKEHLLQSLGAE